MTNKKNWLSKIKSCVRATRRVAPTIFLAIISAYIGYAATQSADFSATTQAELYDSARIEITGGKLQLKAQRPWWRHDSKTEFDAGTYSDSEYLNTTSLATSESAVVLSATGLVAHYPMTGSDADLDTNDTAGLEDTKSTYEGTANNTNSTGMAHVTGRFGNGVNFDGTDDHISIADSANLRFDSGAQDFTISAWFKRGANGSNHTIASKLDGAGDGWSLTLTSANLIECAVDALTVSSTSTITDTNWHHVACKIDRDGLGQIYLDGVANGTPVAMNSEVMATTAALRIGRGLSANYFNGIIDDVSLYNIALTKDEIEMIAAAGSAVHMKPTASITPHAPKLSSDFPGIVAYWPFDNASGTVAPDMIGPNRGTLNNMETPTDWVTGVNGKGLQLDGTDEYISVPDKDALSFPHRFTFSAWFKATSLKTTNAAEDTIAIKKGASGQYEYLVTARGNGTTSRIRFFVFNDANGTYLSVSGTTDLQTNTWYHVAATLDQASTTAKVYLNGAQEGSSNSPSGTRVLNGTGTMRIGYDTSVEAFTGIIDEVALFNRVLSANEILFLAGKKGETATYTSPVMDGEIAAAKWDKISMNYSKVTAGMEFVKTNLGGSGGVWSLGAGDLDGDGDMDMLYSNASAAKRFYWFKDYVLTDFTGGANNAAAIDIATGDLNNDGDIDVLFADHLATVGVKWYSNDGAASPTFTLETSISTDADPNTVAIADIDNDGDNDVIAGFAGSTDKIVWYANDGAATPTFTVNGTAIVTGFDAYEIKIADINGDGFMDVAAADYAGNKVTWFKGDGGSSWTATNIVTSGFNNPYDVFIADVDKDGDLDVAAASNGSAKISWFVNDGSATPAFSTMNNLSASYTSATSIAAVDMDNDGDTDFVTAAAGTSDDIDWWRNDGAQNFTQFPITTAWVTSLDPNKLIVTDMNGDGNLDIAVALPGSTQVAMFINTPWKQFRTNFGASQNESMGDIDGDGILDVVMSFPNGVTEVSWWKLDGSTTFVRQSAISGITTDVITVVADVDLDGKADVVGYDGTAQELAWWKQGADTSTWTKQTIQASQAAGWFPVVADIDNDGKMDVFMTADGAVDEVAYWHDDDNDGTWTKISVETGTDALKWIKVIDLDSDGRLDILVGNVINSGNRHTYAFYQQAGLNAFDAKVDLGSSASGIPQIADLDNDGWLDVCRTGTSFGVTCARQTSARTFAAGVQIWEGDVVFGDPIGFQDVDGDGDIDILSKLYLVENNGPAFLATSWIGLKIEQNNAGAAYNIWRTKIVDMNSDGLPDLVTRTSAVMDLYIQQPYAKAWTQVRTDTTSSPATTFVGSYGSIDSAVSSGTGILSTLDSNRYFQWNTKLYRNDTTLDPMIKNVRLDYRAKTYSTLNPYAISTSAPSFTYLTGFTATTETEPAGSDIKYQLSQDGGTTWRYYSGGWNTSNGTFAQSSDAATINTNIATFEDNMSAPGVLKWKAIMNSDGDVQPSVEAIDVAYENVILTLADPNGGEVWKNGSAHLIEWTLGGGTVPNDLILEYNTAGSTSIFGSNIASGLNSTHHNEEVMSGAVGVWHFGTTTSGSIADTDATAGLLDSVSSIQGTASNANGTGMAFTSGKFGAGINFDGTDDRIDLPGAAALQLTGAATVSAWIHVDQNTDEGIYQNASGASVSNFMMYLDNGKLNLKTVTSAWAGATTVTTGTWHHVAISRSGSSGNWDLRFYLNGVLDGSSTTTVNPSGGTYNSRIGDISTSHPMDGRIDEVAVFNRALSAGEIAALAAANPGYVWTVPNEDATNVRVRVRSSSTGTLSDYSDANFTIANIAITSPNGAEVWKVGTSHAITWTSNTNANFNDYILEYTTAVVDPASTGSDPVTTWVQIATGQTGSGGTYSWTIPNQVSSTARVRIRSAANTDFVDVSNANFAISELAMVNPNGSNVIYEGEKYQVTWGHAGTSLADLVLELDTGGGYGAFSPAANSLSVRRGDSASRFAGLNPASISGAVGVWRLNEGTGTSVYDIVGTNTGTLAGSTAWTTGQFGNALTFDGSGDYVSMPHHASLAFGTGDFTIGTWIKAPTNAIGNIRGIMGKLNGGVNDEGYILYFSSGLGGKPVCNIRSGGVGSSIASQISADDDAWHHVACVRSTTVLSVYVDGVLQGSVTHGVSGTLNDATQTFDIGAYPAGFNYFIGKIDEPAAYNRALTNAELRALAGGTYEWTVPDVPSVTTRVRVRSAAATDLTDTSDANLEIRARSGVVSTPNGGEAFAQGSTQYITWTPAGLLSNNLTIDLSLDSGGQYLVGNQIATGIDAGGKPFANAVGAWGLGEGTGQTVADKSGTSNNGTLGSTSGVATNDPAWVLGKFGSALDFDGVNDFVNVPYHSSMDRPNAFSMAVWAKSGKTGAAYTDHGMIMDMGFYSSTGYGIFVVSGGATIYGYYNTGAISTGAMDTSWHHYALTYDGTTLIMYKDGISAGSVATAPTTVTNNDLKLGGESKSSIRFFQGQIDEAHIYSRALTQAEITQLASGKGVFAWTVPATPYTTLRVRVRDANRVASTDESNADFAITSIALTNPNGANTLTVGEQYPITWSTNPGIPADLILEYGKASADFTTPTSIATALNAYNHNEEKALGAVGVWHFDGTLGAIGDGATAGLEDSKVTYHGTASNVGGTGMSFVAGKFGNGIDFDGTDDYVNVGNVKPTLATFSAWVKTDVTVSSDVDCWISHARSTPGLDGSSFQVGINASDQFYAAGRTTALGSVSATDTTTTTTIGQWYHMAATFDGTNLTLYINGTQTAQAGFASNLQYTGSNSTLIGKREYGGIQNPWDGVIDEVAVFNRALTTAEITALASNNGAMLWTVPDENSDTVRVRVRSSAQTSLTDISDADLIVTGGANDTRVWDNTSGDGLWSNAANWTNNIKPVAGNDVVFNGTSNTAVTADVVPQNLNSISLNAGYTNTVTFQKAALGSAMILTLAGDLNVNSGTLVFEGDTAQDSFVGNDPYIGSDVNDGKGFTVNVANVTVANGAKISVDAQGFPSGQGPAAGSNITPSGYGGSGAGGIIYGSITAPTSLGSGADGAGGGALKLNVTSTTTVNGIISADALDSSSGGIDPASGGSLWIITNTLAGGSTGMIRADGGSQTTSGYSGGGGRVAITWNSVTYTGKFSVAQGSTDGTAISTKPSNPGTLSIPWASITDYTVDTGFTIAPAGAYTFGNWTVTGANTQLGLLGGTNAVTFGNLTLSSGAKVVAFGDTATDSIGGNDAFQGAGINDGTGVTINATNITVNSGTAITATGQGFKSNTGPGYTFSQAGSYGGEGGGNANKKYGSLTQPTSLGSAGYVSNSAYQAFGGGAIKLNVTNTLTIDGTVSSNGNNLSTGTASKFGSGGSLWIITDTFAGAGTGIIEANGGYNVSGSDPGSFGGGGGRVSIDWATASTYAGSIAADGAAEATPGANGTIVYLEASAPNGAEIYKVGSAHAIHWVAGRDVPSDLILEYATNGSNFASPTSITTALNPNTLNEEKFSGIVGSWHFGTATSGLIANGATVGLEDTFGTNEGTAVNPDGVGMAFTAGKFGGAVNFDATDSYITAGDNSSMDITGALSLSAWIKTNDTASTRMIFNNSWTSGSGLNYRLQLISYSGGSLQFCQAHSGCATSAYAISTAGGITTGTWYHVAATRTGSSGAWDTKVYVNGVLSGSNTLTSNPSASAQPLHIGASQTGTSLWYGIIDEASIFNRALTAGEVAHLASNNPGYLWTVPDENDNDIRVRVRSSAQANLTDISNANFTVTDIALTSPNGAEVWKVGTTNHAITWTADSLANQNDYILEYTTAATDPTTTGSDPLTTWVEIANGLSGAGGTHTWAAVPDSVSATARIRLRSASVATDLADVSNANFTIADLAMTNPNGSNVIYEGEKYPIAWAQGGTSLADLILEYDTGSGYGAFSPAANSLSVRRVDAASRFAGLNPASITGAVGVWRLNEGAGTSVADSAGSNTGTVTGATWVDGQSGKALDFDGVGNYVALTDLADSTNLTLSAWIEPDAVAGIQYILGKMEGTNDGFAVVQVGAQIQAILNTVNFLSKTILVADTKYHVAVTNDGTNLKIYINGILDSSASSTGQTVSTGTVLANIARRSDTTNSYFNGMIDDAAIFNAALSAADIRKLAGGTYEWTIPDVPSATTKVRVRSAAATDLTDFSDANLEIRARSVTVNSPDGTESYQEGSRQTIQWTPAGLMSNNLTVEYCQGAGCTSAVSIATGVDAGGKPFEGAGGAWGFGEGTGQTVADKSGNSITGTLGGSGAAASDDPVFVLGKFGHALNFDGVNDYVQYPDILDFNATESFSLSAWVNVNAATSGAIVNKHRWGGYAGYSLRTSSSRNVTAVVEDAGGGSTGLTSTSPLTANTWTHVLMVVDRNAQTLGLYVNGTLQGSTTSTAAVGDLTSGRFLGVGAAHGSTWGNFFRGLIDEVHVYKRALTSTEIAALASGRANFPWTVPNDESATVRVRVTDANRAASTDLSNANFAITPRTLAVAAPNGAEVFPYNSVQYLTWDTTGPLSNNLTLRYDPDSTGGASFPTTIATGVDAGGSPLSGALGAWGMGEGSGTSLTDKSGNNETGTLSLGTVGNKVVADAWKVGKLGYGLDFDGADDYVNAGDLGAGIQTISFWMKADVTASKKIINIDGTDQIELDGSSNVTATSFPGTTVIYVDGVAGANIPNTNWHHVLITDTTGVTGTTFEIGRVGSSYFDGMIDEVHVYNRVLSAGEITALASGKGVYPWTIPDPGFSSGTRLFPNSQVRITDANRSATTDDSDANFNVRTPILTLTAPPPPAAVPYGAAQNITWTNNSATQGGPIGTNLRIEYSTDDGGTWPGGSNIIIVDESANGGPVTTPFNWGVTAGAVSNTVKVRVQDNAFPYAEGITSTFKVTGSTTVIKPNGNEKWAAGFAHDITWQRLGNITNVKIFTHNGDGVPITTITNSTDASTGLLSWTPAVGEAGTGLKIRVQDASDVDVYDDTNGTFSVSRVTVGNPASRLPAGASINITWTHVGLTNVRLQYSMNGTFSDAQDIVATTAAGAGTYGWTVPQTTTTTFKVRASDPDAPGVGDQSLAIDPSDANSTIHGYLTVLIPSNSGVVWAAGQQQTITWETKKSGNVLATSTNTIPNVKITAAKNGNFNDSSGGNIVTISASAPNHNNPGVATGSFNWTPTFTSTLAKVRVEDADDPLAANLENRDDSNNFFEISGISIVQPAGGETAIVNASFPIEFAFTGSVTNVDIHYSPDAGSTWIPVATNLNVSNNPMTYTWTNVPDNITILGKVRVRDAANNPNYAISSNFNIKGAISVTTPGTILYVSDPYTIQWSSTGSMPNQRIEFSKNGLFNGDEIVIANLTGLSGGIAAVNQSYAWPSGVADQIGSAGKFRVTDTTTHANGSLVTSTMSNAFSIGAKFTFTSPTNAASWIVGDPTHDITWTSVGTISDVKLEYLAENDAYSAATVITASTEDDGTRVWNPISDIVSLRGQDPQVDRDILVKLRISDADPTHPASATDSQIFTVKWSRVTWNIRDADTSGLLSALSVAETNSGANSTWSVQDNSLNSAATLQRNYKYDTYTTTWSKVGYASISLESWLADADKTNNVYLINEATANVEHRVMFGYTYNDSTKTLTAKTWLERIGRIQTQANLLGASTVKIYNGANLIATLSDPAVDAGGFYEFSFDNSADAIVFGTIYSADAEIVFNGAPRNTGHSITISELSKLAALDANITQVITDVAGVSTAVGNVNTAIGTVNTKVDTANAALGSINDIAGANSLVGMIKEVQNKQGDVTVIEDNTTELLDEVKNKLAARIQPGNKGGRGQLIKRNTRFAIGETASIRYQHDIGLAPKADVYGPDNKLLLAAQPMVDGNGNGIYTFDFKILTTYKTGDYTIMVTETSSGFLDSMVLSVIGTSEEDTASAVMSASSFSQSASSDARKVYDAMQSLKNTLGGDDEESMVSQLQTMEQIMGQMKKSLFTLTGEAGAGEDIVTVAEVHDSVLDVMKEIRDMVSKKGINLDSVYKTVEGQGETTKEIQNMATAIQAVSLTTMEMIEKAQDKPVMTTWFEG